MSNHLLFGSTLLLSNPPTTDLSYRNLNSIIKPTKLHNIITFGIDDEKNIQRTYHSIIKSILIRKTGQQYY